MKPFILTVSKVCVLLLATLVVGSLLAFSQESQPILIQSQESKNVLGEPVFNQIRFIPSKDKDVWMMNQSHHGLGVPGDKWDRLAIVVDKTKTPKTARFFQLEPGPLEWKEGLKELPYRVSCFLCHNNGPRAIRPDAESPLAKNDFLTKLRIQYWNLKMKMYGRVLTDPLQSSLDENLVVPLRYTSAFENETLQVKSCTKCHKDEGFFARGALHRQQAITISHLLESGEMPPPGFFVTAEDREKIRNFVSGF